MRKRVRIKERLTQVALAPRLYYAVVPLALPLVLATVTPGAATPEQAPARSAAPVSVAPLVIDPALLASRNLEPLPRHAVHLVVESGDTLDSILQTGGLGRGEAALLVKQFSDQIDPRRLRPGQKFSFDVRPDGVVEQVSARITGWGDVRATRNASGFEVSAIASPVRVEPTVVTADIDRSLYDAITSTGETGELVQRLVDVFQWDVDFFRLQKGDRFTLLVDKKYAGDDMTGYGPVIAARFEHKGEVYEAFRFQTPDGHAGYYNSQGTPMRKQFLKSPLRFSRITSGFTRKRFHPILKVFRPHHGVDYGAPVGTPVMATADGVVTFAGFERAEGNYVKIKHNARLQTCYLHLSRFAKGVKKGTRVQQGDVIGYVGATGLASGPHLDYRVSDGGDWINPLKLKSVTADPLHGATLAKFKATVGRSIEAITQSQQTRVASQTETRPALF